MSGAVEPAHHPRHDRGTMHAFMRGAKGVVGALTVALGAACGGSSHDDHAVTATDAGADGASQTANDGGNGASDSGLITCRGTPGAEVYSANMVKSGAANVFRFTLLSSDPAPPARPVDNVWIVAIADANGSPIDNATVTASPYMPAHGHGSMKDAQVVAKGGGTYEIKPIYFTMPGLWEVTLKATVDVTGSSQQDAATFAFCID